MEEQLLEQAIQAMLASETENEIFVEGILDLVQRILG